MKAVMLFPPDAKLWHGFTPGHTPFVNDKWIQAARVIGPVFGPDDTNDLDAQSSYRPVILP